MPMLRSACDASLGHRAIVRLALVYYALLAATTSVGATPPPSLYAPASCEELQRSGYPDECFRWAKPQRPCDYIGYYVGGGAPRRVGHYRCASDGTWGWDYFGRWVPRRVRLEWFCFPRRQGGQGSYQPDGPRVLDALAEAGHDSSH